MAKTVFKVWDTGNDWRAQVYEDGQPRLERARGTTKAAAIADFKSAYANRLPALFPDGIPPELID